MPTATQPAAAIVCPRIGVFDSGVGGLSVLRELRRELPGASLHYVADSGHAPYGERGEEHVIARSQRVAAHLIDCGATIIVIACNTATAAAARSLRERWPRMPFVGVEPGIKPALTATRNGRIGVMATRGTLGSEKFRRLADSLMAEHPLHLQACDGLATAIEQGFPDAPGLLSLVEQHCKPLRDAGVDTVVLGCTHYAFARQHIQAALGPDVLIIDTAAAVAARTTAVAREALPCAAIGCAQAPTMTLHTTGSAALLERIAHAWLGETITASHITA